MFIAPELLLILLCLLGLLIGSFLNVCIFRIPITQDLFDEEYYPNLKILRDEFQTRNQKISISFPARSFCTSCKHELSWYHNLPVLSWLFLSGKCAFCKEVISVRYPVVELLSALAAAGSVFLFDISWAALASYVICACFIVISFIDYDHFMIPDVITFQLVPIGVILAGINQYTHFLPIPFSQNLIESFLGFLAGAGVLYIVSKTYLLLRKREGLGLGDVKLLAVTGVWFGYQGAFFTIFVGSLLGSIFGVLFILMGKNKLAQEIPFGPYLCIANLLYIFNASDRGQLVIEPLLRSLGF
jgi:leader peptidase (prepilin peptidase)/N-methyltransferase